ncbi:hypothetical protein HK405_015158 [Cladochytrium tenue]|nr:hypothetical protein HK405_015158 [Cladochytrium tenue]
MRLLNVLTNKVEYFDGPESAPAYAAISYVWPPENAAGAQPWTRAVLPTASGRLALFRSEWPIPSCNPLSLAEALRAIYVDGTSVLDDDDEEEFDGTGDSRNSSSGSSSSSISSKGKKKRDPVAPTTCPAFTHLWMDVICVNQVDDADKARDVARMKDYYSRSVCTWVFLEHLGMRSMPLTYGGGRPARWFSRLWTLQECVLPKKLFFYLESAAGCAGDAAGMPTSGIWVSRRHVRTYVATAAPVKHPGTPTEQYRYAIQLMPLTVTRPSIRTAVLLAAVRECRYEVDRFYGILGMLPSDTKVFDWSKFAIDFKKDMNEVKYDFVAALGPEIVLSFAAMAAADHEEGSKSAADENASWFASFLPGMYHSASIDKGCELKELVSFLTDDAYDRKQFWDEEYIRATRFSDFVVRASATADSGGVFLQGVPVISLSSSISAIKRPFASSDTRLLYVMLLELRSSINRRMGKWAQKEAYAYFEYNRDRSQRKLVKQKLANSFFNAFYAMTSGKYAGATFCYPPPALWSVSATTRGGRGIVGLGGRYDLGGTMESGQPRELVLVYTGQSVTTFDTGLTSTRQSDDFAVCEVLKGPVASGRSDDGEVEAAATVPSVEDGVKASPPGDGIVVRKLGVLHVQSYYSTPLNGEEGTKTLKPMPAKSFDDFVVMDVIFK